MSEPRSSSAQDGVALIGAMLITLVIVAIATNVGVRSLRDIAASARLGEFNAATEIFDAIEQDSRTVLRSDGLSANVDSLDEPWAQNALEIDTPAGRGAARLVDLQGRFNLNSLAFDAAAADAGATSAAADVDSGDGTSSDGAQLDGRSVAEGIAPTREAAPTGTTGSEGSAGRAAPETTDVAAGAPRKAPPGMKLVERSYATATGHQTRYFDAVADGSDAGAATTAGAAGEGGSGADGEADPVRAQAVAALARVPALAASLSAQGAPGANAAGAAPATVRLTPQQIAIARFALLLSALELDDALVPAILDWLDGDTDTRFPNGAEDDYYSELDQPYRAANRRFAALEELKLVRGVDAEVYAKLAPHVTVLPGDTAINVNTAGLAILRSLSPAIDSGTAAQIVNARDVQAFQSVAQFLALPVLFGRPLLADGLTTTSDFFALSMRVRSGRSEIAARSVLARNDPANIEIVSRARGFGDE